MKPAPANVADGFFADIARLFDAPIIALGQDRNILLMNVAAEQLTGWSASDAAGTFFGDVLSLDQHTCDELCPPDTDWGNVDEQPWQEFACSFNDRTPHSVKIRRKPLFLPGGGIAVVLVLDALGPWEQRYKDVLAGSPVIFFEASGDGQIVYGADQLARALGYSEKETASKTFFDLVTTPQRDTLHTIWGHVLEGQQVRGRELRLSTAGSGAQPFWFSFFPVAGMKGETVGVRGTASDLATQKSLAYALESAEERFNVLFRESSDPILILSMSGEIMSANPSFERITGIRSDELFCGEKSWASFVSDSDLSVLMDSIRRCAESGKDDTVEFRVIREDEVVWFEESHSILHDERGNAKGIMAVARDIHARKQQELALLERAEDMQRRHQRAQALIAKLKSFFTNISSLPTDIDSFLRGVCDLLFDMYRPLRVVIHVTDKAVRVHEVGGSLPESLLDEDGRPMQSRMTDSVLESSLPIYCNTLQETEPYNTDPVVTGLNLNTYLGAPLRDSTGKMRGTLSLVDTETRAFDSLDVELITVAALHVAARLRAEEQEEVKRELEEHLRQAQKMEAVGMLAGGIAHDFNNILSGILGFSSFLLSKQEEGTDLYRNLELIEQSAVRASELTRQLLAFSRRKHFAKQPVSMNQITKDVLSILQRSLAKNIVIRSEPSADLPMVLGDPGQLNQVMMNLCLNAADAMAQQGGTLRIKTAHRLLTSRERTVLVDAGQGEYVCITVSDTGKGMSQEVQEHIFDPFFTTKSDMGGSGLGLSIVYGIVTNHNGDIIVESAEGKGAVFKIYFPVHKGEVKKEEAKAPLQLRGTETILVVDDETIVRQMVTAVLKEYGYKVLAVPSGAEAVEMLKELQGRIHLVLLDMVMPGMDGEMTFHALREVDTEVPVLLTSGFAEEERSNRLIKAGAKGMIHKPYKSEALAARIRKILSESVWSET